MPPLHKTKKINHKPMHDNSKKAQSFAKKTKKMQSKNESNHDE